MSGSQRLVNFLLKFERLCFVLSDQVFFYFLGFLLVLSHLLVPEAVEFGNLLNVSHFDLLFLFFVFDKHLLSFMFFEVSSHFGESFFGEVCFDVLARFFALFLMSVKDLPG